MKTVTERHAEKWLPLLIDEVERGEAISIVRDGKPVAELQPVEDIQPLSPSQTPSWAEVEAAMHRIRARAVATDQSFDWDEVKAWRDEGRA